MTEFNMAKWTKEQQKAAQRDKTAALWAYHVKIGKTTKEQIVRRIWALKEPEKVQDMMQRFTKYLEWHNPYLKRSTNRRYTETPDWAPKRTTTTSRSRAPTRGHRPRMAGSRPF